MGKVSVIIPCYNVEPYIGECLDSVIGQTIGKENLEIIVVDDCSTDNTVQILQAYETRYPEQMIVVLCEQNGRQGTARNIGLSYASGEFVSFVDSDDYIVSDMYEQLLDAMEKSDADVAQFRYTENPEELYQRSKLTWQVYDYSCEANRRSYLLQDQIMNNSCTTKLYRKSLLDRAGTMFGEGVCYEEPLFTYPLKYYVKKVCVTEQPFYYYRPNEGGTTIDKMSQPDTIMDHLQVQLTLYEWMRQLPFYQEYQDEIDLYFLHSFFVEPIYFYALRHLAYPVELLRRTGELVLARVPDWNTNRCLPDESLIEDRRALMLLDYLDKDDMWLAEQLSFLFLHVDDAYMTRLLKEMTQGIQKGMIYDSRLYGLSYFHLMALFLYENQKEKKSDLYSRVYKAIMKNLEIRIRDKVARGEKIKVAFLPISASEWPAQEVYRRLEADQRFDVMVVPLPLMDRKYDYRKKTYDATVEYFRQNHYRVREVYDSPKDICFGWQEIGGMADIVIHVTFWTEALPAAFRIEQYPLSCLNVYIPYGVSVAESKAQDYSKTVTCNSGFMNMQWQIYTDSAKTKEEFEKYQLLKGENVSFSGYTKMDYFFEPHTYTREQIRAMWSVPEGVDVEDRKRVLVASHHSLGDTLLSYSTFAANKDLLLSLAEKYQDKICFVWKPHPNLRMKAIETGLFADEEAYDAYVAKWNELPNVRVVEEGDYLALFDTSHGMIMDCVSFIGEYLYADKPMLFLKRESQRFSPLGKTLMGAHYKVKGDDAAGIERYLQEVILEGKDTRAKLRREIFEKELDYRKKNGMKASEYMYQHILQKLSI